MKKLHLINDATQNEERRMMSSCLFFCLFVFFKQKYFLPWIHRWASTWSTWPSPPRSISKILNKDCWEIFQRIKCKLRAFSNLLNAQKKKTKWYTIVILTRANLHLTAAHVSSILLTLAVHSSFQPYCQFELKTQILHYLQAANWCRTHQTAELPGAMTLTPNPLRQNTSHYGNQQYHDLLERPLLSFITVSWRKVKSKPAQSYFFQNQLSLELSLILPLGCCKFIQHLGLWYFQIKDPEARDTIENKIPLLRSWKTFFFSTRSQILRENEHVKSNAAY